MDRLTITEVVSDRIIIIEVIYSLFFSSSLVTLIIISISSNKGIDYEFIIIDIRG